MPPSLSSLIDEARLSIQAIGELGPSLVRPKLRLGVTGLSRAGKTVFLTALIHNLVHGSRLPVFEAMASGRLARAQLEPQPDDAVPRFDYEAHVAAIDAERRWPESTRRISELRLSLEYRSRRNSARARTLTLDIVDYPGEWLLDLPLLDQSFAEWSASTVALSREHPRADLAREWHAHLATLSNTGPADEQAVLTASRLFTDYLRACRDERFAMSLLPPGRFLMPGDLEGSPALTFAPLDPAAGTGGTRSLWGLMEHRYEAYKNVLVRPFFRDHFARLDRQVVLVDALTALNAGPSALRDLERSLAAILACFRVGRGSWLSGLIRPRIDRILFAATKADHLHRENHDRLEAIMRRLTERAIERARFSGAMIDVAAIAAVRATREARITHGRESLPAIIGTPAPGQSSGAEIFDGTAETAVFPGDLPENPDQLFAEGVGSFQGLTGGSAAEADYRFLRFLPPRLVADGGTQAMPHIRLDRALQFLLGDKLA